MSHVQPAFDGMHLEAPAQGWRMVRAFIGWPPRLRSAGWPGGG